MQHSYRKEQKNFDENNHIETLSAQIKKLKDENDFNQRQKNQDIKKEISDYEAEIIRLNKIINDKDEEAKHDTKEIRRSRINSQPTSTTNEISSTTKERL